MVERSTEADAAAAAAGEFRRGIGPASHAEQETLFPADWRAGWAAAYPGGGLGEGGARSAPPGASARIAPGHSTGGHQAPVSHRAKRRRRFSSQACPPRSKPRRTGQDAGGAPRRLPAAPQSPVGPARRFCQKLPHQVEKVGSSCPGNRGDQAQQLCRPGRHHAAQGDKASRAKGGAHVHSKVAQGRRGSIGFENG